MTRKPMKRVCLRCGFCALACLWLVPGAACGQFVVDAGGGGTHTSIQAAINDAANGLEIIVMPGQYAERIDFSGKAVRVRGADPFDRTVVEQTIVDAGSTGTVVNFSSGEGAGSVLEGLTIVNGKSDTDGGGVVCLAGSSPTILRNVILANVCPGSGGGIYLADGASPRIEFNTIVGNRCGARGGGIYADAASPVIMHNVIDGNQAGCSAGGGIYLAAGTDGTVVEANDILRNFARLGGGIAVADSDVRIERNRLINNYGIPRGGGVSLSNADATLVSNIIAGNRSAVAAGVDSAQSSPVLRGNTILGNWATDDAILLFLGSSQPELTGNIIAFSQAGVGVLAVAGASVTADRNCFFANIDGDTSGSVTLGPDNLLADPKLVEPGIWEPGILLGNDEVPCDAGDRFEFVANYVGPGPARGYAQYRLRPERERFDISLFDFPPGAHAVFVRDVNVGQIFVDGGGAGVLEFDTNDGTFPPSFPDVIMGNVVRIGSVTEASLGPAWSGTNEQWVNGDPHLGSSSPARDAGPTSIPVEDVADIDGQPRFASGAMDIGADETVPPGDGDFDSDGDVDFADAQALQLCFRGAPGSLPDPACSALDVDGDADVDSVDWVGFLDLVTGPE